VSKEALSFEQSMERLEEIAKLLENEKLDIDKALALFEEGTKLSGSLHKSLEQAEQKISTLFEGK